MQRSTPLVSVVIPAHNESAVIGRCLDALFTGIASEDLDVVVVCNGCHDDTAERARRSGWPARVLELREASKPAALRAGDAAARTLPRLYVDADVRLPGRSAIAVAQRLHAGAIAARPPILYDSTRSSPLVRSYYRARSDVPSVMKSLWGAGVCGLSAAGRARFDTFPDVVGDDLWLDGQFSPDEVEIVECAPVIVGVPRRSRDLVHTLRRTYRGKAEHHLVCGVNSRTRETTASALRDLGRLAATRPRSTLDVAMYAAFAAGARLALSLGGYVDGARVGPRWERDESSRAS